MPCTSGTAPALLRHGRPKPRDRTVGARPPSAVVTVCRAAADTNARGRGLGPRQVWSGRWRSQGVVPERLARRVGAPCITHQRRWCCHHRGPARVPPPARQPLTQQHPPGPTVADGACARVPHACMRVCLHASAGTVRTLQSMRACMSREHACVRPGTRTRKCHAPLCSANAARPRAHALRLMKTLPPRGSPALRAHAGGGAG